MSISTTHSRTEGRPAGQPATSADVELFNHVESNLYTAVVADSLDELTVARGLPNGREETGALNAVIDQEVEQS